MTMFKSTSILLILIVLVSFSCSKNASQDSEPPVINEIKTLNSEGVEEIEFPAGSSIKFVANYSDNIDLGSYRTELHYAGDGHRHYIADPRGKKATSLEDWEFIEFGDFSGKNQTISFTKTVSVDAKASPYHVITYATDDAGNYADFKISEFLITRADMPTIDITSPDFDGLQVPRGEKLIISGAAFASKGISKIQLIARGVEINSEDEVLNKFENYDGKEKEIAIQDTITIASDAVIGDYLVLILASDTGGSVGQFLNSFEIVE